MTFEETLQAAIDAAAAEVVAVEEQIAALVEREKRLVAVRDQLRSFAAEPFKVGDDPHPTPSRRIGPAPRPAKQTPPPSRKKERPDVAAKKKGRRQFTDQQKAHIAAAARTNGVRAAAKEFDIVESVIRRWMAEHPAGLGGGGKLESTPATKHVDKSASDGAASSLDFDSRDKTARPGERNLPAPTQPDNERAALLVLLDHPEWIEGATRRTTAGHDTAWVRRDGQHWECSCGKKACTIGQLRVHMQSVVIPEHHTPLISASPDASIPPVVNELHRLRPTCDRCKPAQTFPTTASYDAHIERCHPAPAAKAGLVPTGLPRTPHPVERARIEAYEEEAS